MSKTTLTKDRTCTMLREVLYKISNSENQAVYTPLELKWTLPVDSPKGMISVLKNVVIVMGYVQKHNCNKECIDKIVENDIRPMVKDLKDELDMFATAVIMVMYALSKLTLKLLVVCPLVLLMLLVLH